MIPIHVPRPDAVARSGAVQRVGILVLRCERLSDAALRRMDSALVAAVRNRPSRRPACANTVQLTESDCVLRMPGPDRGPLIGMDARHGRV